jgi:hypothetical protein
MENIHKYKFAGIDTSHFRKPKEGDFKSINGTLYVYLPCFSAGGKLRLFLVRELVKEIIQAAR